MTGASAEVTCSLVLVPNNLGGTRLCSARFCMQMGRTLNTPCPVLRTIKALGTGSGQLPSAQIWRMQVLSRSSPTKGRARMQPQGQDLQA